MLKVNQRCLNDELAPIHIVALNGPLPMLEALLDAGADKNLESGSSCLPLHYAAAGGQKNIVSTLIRAGSSPTATDNQGLCSIHFAAHKLVPIVLLYNQQRLNLFLLHTSCGEPIARTCPKWHHHRHHQLNVHFLPRLIKGMDGCFPKH